MKTIAVSVVALILTATSSLAGNCSKHTAVNLEAMSCQAGYTWDAEAETCVKAPQA